VYDPSVYERCVWNAKLVEERGELGKMPEFKLLWVRIIIHFPGGIASAHFVAASG
jgi:hypothetical protein